ncbi:MAG: type II CRISPR RNA-guided endonuclease Cas9 [Rhodospirillales bacterium]|nr:type II CRISPR RNA-guided endonuclease Cas9 [Rhodospirillales bacterium]
MRIFGLDGGIASIGWAVIDQDGEGGRIIACGSRCFDPPETAKERTPTNALRRQYRLARRVVRRRRQRMQRVRHLLAEHGLLAGAGRDALRARRLDPWALRADGLDRALTAGEFAAVLGHIARHRGFWSNSKRDRGANAADDTSKMLKAMETTRARLGAWRSVGEMLARDPAIGERKRNRGGDYSRTVLRDDLRHETRLLFERQHALGNPFATAELEAAYAPAAFDQRPLQDSEHLLAKCLFEREEKRTARRSYVFEMFRLLSRLANLKLATSNGERRLGAEEIRRIADDFGHQKGITYKSLRRLLDLDPGARFADVGPEDEGRDVVARTGNAAEGSYTLRQTIGAAPWAALRNTPERLDRIAEVLTFRESLPSIRRGLDEAGVEPLIAEAILAGVEDGKFRNFTGAGHISAKAARRIIPHLARGMVYSEACAEAGYDHAARAPTALAEVKNPVARKALGEMLKQVRALIAEYGLPERMHVELARDVGKSAEERAEIKNGIDKRNKERDRARERFRELLGREPAGADDMLRFELYEEQCGRCLYSDEEIPPTAIFSSDNRVQVDHILPWSRFGDDSFINKTLCLASANQNKRGRTPYEWFQQDRPQDWEAFGVRVGACLKMKGRKKRGFYLRQNASEVEEAFRNRNLGDTRYATRLLLEFLARHYPADGQVHVLARPGALTAKLRRAWGLEGVKKGEDGKRLPDDRHHALDAVVLAATGQAMVERLTRAFQEAERRGLPREFGAVSQPWPGFREETEAAVAAVFVSRSERRRARGEAHAATIKQVRTIDGADIVFERKDIFKLTPADLDRIPIPAPYGRVTDPAGLRDAMVVALRSWIEAGKRKDSLPRSAKGDVIRKVRVASDGKVAVQIRGGTADRGEMTRVDVFRTTDRKGRARFHLVPIYPHQVADRINHPAPPNRAVVAYKPENEWTLIDNNFEFLFSLYPNSLVEVTKSGGEIIGGYFKGLHRGTGAINLAQQKSQSAITDGIGAKTLLALRKHTVDRLGRVSEVPRETRTWHGVACT